MKNLKFSRFKIQKISDWNIMDEQNVNIRSNMANFHIYIRGQIGITWYVQPIYFSMYTKLSLSSTNLYIKTLFGQFVLLQDHILSVIYGSYFKWALHMPKDVILRMDQRSKCHTRSRPRICSFLLTMGRRYIARFFELRTVTQDCSYWTVHEQRAVNVRRTTMKIENYRRWRTARNT